ncbi:hypothetical protein QOT17_023595 [Balamuthia mandrillaris]
MATSLSRPSGENVNPSKATYYQFGNDEELTMFMRRKAAERRKREHIEEKRKAEAEQRRLRALQDLKRFQELQLQRLKERKRLQRKALATPPRVGHYSSAPHHQDTSSLIAPSLPAATGKENAAQTSEGVMSSSSHSRKKKSIVSSSSLNNLHSGFVTAIKREAQPAENVNKTTRKTCTIFQKTTSSNPKNIAGAFFSAKAKGPEEKRTSSSLQPPSIKQSGGDAKEREPYADRKAQHKTSPSKAKVKNIVITGSTSRRGRRAASNSLPKTASKGQMHASSLAPTQPRCTAEGNASNTAAKVEMAMIRKASQEEHKEGSGSRSRGDGPTRPLPSIAGVPSSFVMDCLQELKEEKQLQRRLIGLYASSQQSSEPQAIRKDDKTVVLPLLEDNYENEEEATLLAKVRQLWLFNQHALSPSHSRASEEYMLATRHLLLTQEQRWLCWQDEEQQLEKAACSIIFGGFSGSKPSTAAMTAEEEVGEGQRGL